jgi:hypothetical protein
MLHYQNEIISSYLSTFKRRQKFAKLLNNFIEPSVPQKIVDCFLISILPPQVLSFLQNNIWWDIAVPALDIPMLRHFDNSHPHLILKTRLYRLTFQLSSGDTNSQKLFNLSVNFTFKKYSVDSKQPLLSKF